MSNNNEQYSIGLTFPVILSNIFYWFKLLLRKWWLIGIIAVAGAALGFTYAYTKKPAYKATMTFMVEEGKSGSLSSISSIASQFGINMGGGDDNIFTASSIVELVKSRSMVEKALLSEGTFGNKKELLINHYIEFNNLRSTWDDEQLKNIKFSADKSKFTLMHDSVLTSIYINLLEKEIDVVKIDKKLSLIKVECTTKDKEFSKQFTEFVVKALSEYYVMYKTKSARESLEYIQNRTDSVRDELYIAESALARSRDNNARLIKAEGFVSEARLRRQTEILNVMYVELIKNLEIAKMNLLYHTPLFQVIDRPVLPLEKKFTPKRIGFVIGGFIGFVLAVFFLILRKIIIDAMRVLKQEKQA